MMTTHLMRGLNAENPANKGAYLAALAVSMTLMGALSMQAKAISQGKDPRDMTDPKFWGAAAAQGGGGGIFGDLLYSAFTRTGQDAVVALLGPTAGLAVDLVNLTGANVAQAAEDKDTNFGAELARMVRRNTPGTSLWYSRLATDRLIHDRLQTLVDPDYAARFARMEDRALRDYQQQFWWRPGEVAPARGPDLGAGAPVR
jgi:hypothetical protein